MPAVISVHVLPALIVPGSLAGSQAVIVDLLRASTTICAALYAGAVCVRPVLEPGDALALRDQLGAARCVLGGERAGVLVAGFDLGNSPREYTLDSVRGRDVIFTTTNGTRAVYAASEAGAARVLVGCFANLSVITESLIADGRNVRIVCAGTNGEVSMEDVLCAGAIISCLLSAAPAAFAHSSDDQSRIAQRLYDSAAAGPDGVLEAMLASRGGRNLARIGLEVDVRDCARLDWLPVVPVFDPGAGTLTSVA